MAQRFTLLLKNIYWKLLRQVSEDIANLRPMPGQEGDYRSLGPIKVCPCGSDLWNVKCKFAPDDTIGLYFRDMRCALCDSLAVAPYPEWGED